MSKIAQELHTAFADALGRKIKEHSDLSGKPLIVDLKDKSVPRLRVYLYSLVSAASTVRDGEYKIVLRLRGQKVGQYASFDHGDGRFVIVAGYSAELKVFVLWDALLHPKFKNGGNLQVKEHTVRAAASSGNAELRRVLPGKGTEIVIACGPDNLLQALHRHREVVKRQRGSR